MSLPGTVTYQIEVVVVVVVLFVVDRRSSVVDNNGETMKTIVDNRQRFDGIGALIGFTVEMWGTARAPRRASPPRRIQTSPSPKKHQKGSIHIQFFWREGAQKMRSGEPLTQSKRKSSCDISPDPSWHPKKWWYEENFR